MVRQKSTHVDDPMAVGRRLRQARERKGLSQRRLSFPGCTPAYLSRIESGQRIPSLQLLRDLARRLDVSAEYLATGDEEAGRDLLLEAEIALRVDDTDLAEELFAAEYAEAVEAARRGRATGGLGELAYRAGAIDEAIERLVEAQSLLGERLLENPSIPITLSMAYNVRGEHERAIAVYEQALELAKETADRSSETRFSVLLANVLIDQGSLNRSQELLARAIALSAETTDPSSLARLYWAESRLHVAKRSYDLAARYAHLTLASLELSENRYYVARAHHLLAYIELERGDPGGALDLLETALPLIEAAGDRVELTLFRVEKARALLALECIDEAHDLAVSVLPELEHMSRVDTGRARALLGDILARAGRAEEAIEMYRTAVEQLGDSPFALEAYQGFADLLHREGRQAEGFEVLRKALAIRTELTAATPPVR
jgi:transcriptional regulator with XRE-family HTH domain